MIADWRLPIGTCRPFGVGKEEDLAGAAHQFEGLLQGGVGGDGEDGGVQSPLSKVQGLAISKVRRSQSNSSVHVAAAGLRPSRAPSHLVGFDGPFGAELFGQLKAGVEEVGGEDVDAAQLEEASEHQADGPLPCHEHVVAGQKIEAIDGLEDGVHRLKHGTLFKGIFSRDFYDAAQNERHHADVFGKAAAGWFESGCDAGAFVLGALSEGVVAAIVAFHAGDVVMEGDAIAGTKWARGDARPPPADLDDGAGGFVAENARGRDGAVLDFFYVSRANAAGGDFDEEFVAANFWDGDGFGTEIIWAVVNGGEHEFWNDEHELMLTTDEHGWTRIFL